MFNSKWLQCSFILVMCVILSCVFMGCSGSESSAKERLGSHHVTIIPRGHSSMKQVSNKTPLEIFQSGSTEIRIIEDRLFVDNVKYGILEEGEDILVDHGRVFVSGLERRGIVLSKKKLLDFALVKESSQIVGGYRVVVRPGALSTSVSKTWWSNKYNVGKTLIVIKNNRLFVNNMFYGQLDLNDVVLVENTDVYISGKKRKEITH